MIFTKIRDLKYITVNNSHIDLLATCEEYGEISMTLNLVDTENLHTYVDIDEKEYQLEEYCKTQEIAPYEKTDNSTQIKLNEAQYLLDSTQFKFGEDYDLKYTPEWEELKIKRQEAREFIRANK